MATLNAQQIYALARKAGFGRGQAVTATAIALAESGGRTDAVGDTGIQTDKWGPSIGLWQIRSVKAESGKGTARDATRLTDPQFNANSAYAVFKNRGDFTPWSVFTSGKYKAQVTSVETTVGRAESTGGDAWWQRLLDTGGWLDVINPADNGETHVTNTVDATAAWQGNLTRFLETINSGEFWKRFGIGAGGVVVILLAVIILVWAGKDKLLKGTVGSVVNAVKK